MSQKFLKEFKNKAFLLIDDQEKSKKQTLTGFLAISAIFIPALFFITIKLIQSNTLSSPDLFKGILFSQFMVLPTLVFLLVYFDSNSEKNESNPHSEKRKMEFSKNLQDITEKSKYYISLKEKREDNTVKDNKNTLLFPKLSHSFSHFEAPEKRKTKDNNQTGLTITKKIENSKTAFDLFESFFPEPVPGKRDQKKDFILEYYFEMKHLEENSPNYVFTQNITFKTSFDFEIHSIKHTEIFFERTMDTDISEVRNTLSKEQKDFLDALYQDFLEHDIYNVSHPTNPKQKTSIIEDSYDDRKENYLENSQEIVGDALHIVNFRQDPNKIKQDLIQRKVDSDIIKNIETLEHKKTSI